MTPSVVGGTHESANTLLSYDWHTQLNKTQLAAYIRHAYIWRQSGAVSLNNIEHKKKVTRWDGGEDSFGCKFTSVWPRIVKSVLEYQADPGAWVAAQFSQIAMAKRIDAKSSFEARDVTPSELCNQIAPVIYTEHCAKLPALIKEEFQTAGRTIGLRVKSLTRLKLEKADQYLCALCDEGYVTAPPFFRYGFAVMANVPEAIDKYLWPAAFEYESQQRLYDTAVAGTCEWCISEQLKKAVETIRTQWRRAQ
jgi:hypothetical protein